MNLKSELNRTSLTDLGVLRIHGPDAVRFLQGQVSNDVTRLAAGQAVLAGYHTPQGRTIALLRLAARTENELLAILPRELVTSVSQRLAKYVLRSKVTVADASAEWHVSALAPAHELPEGAPAALPEDDLPTPRPGALERRGERIYLGIGGTPARWIEIAPASARCAEPNEAARERWRLLDIRAGLVQVYAATSEHFVAQMLNLDLLDAVAFEKGCYTGQEVIARAHYRGRVKRRAQRLRTREPLTLAPGASGVLADGRAFEVIEAARLEDGRAEFLAVTALPGAAGSAPDDAVRIAADALELPYTLPE